jgi:hypothetical protein
MFDRHGMSPRDIIDRNFQGIRESPAVRWTGGVVPFRDRFHSLSFQTGRRCEIGDAHAFFFQEVRHWLHCVHHFITDLYTVEFSLA